MIRHLSITNLQRFTILFALAISGCASSKLDLNAVSQFSTTTMAAQQSFSDIAADFYASCVREYQLRIPPPPLGPPAGCTQAKADSKDWAATNSIVLSYIKALGDVAGGADATYDYGIPALTSSLQTTSTFNATQVSAINSFSKDVLNVIFEAQQRKLVVSDMQTADSSLKTVLDSLKIVASNYYSTILLDTEQQQLTSFYNLNLPVPRKSGMTQLQILVLKDDYDRRSLQVTEKKAAAVAYGDALDTIESTHSQLLADARSRSLADAVATANTYIQRLGPDISAMKQAFHS